MKQAKIAIIVIGLLLGGFLIVRSITGGGSGLDSDSRVINVITGEVKRMDRKKLSVIPFPDEQNRRALLPAVRDDSGNWVVANAYRGQILQIIEQENLTEADLAIDTTTFGLKK